MTQVQKNKPKANRSAYQMSLRKFLLLFAIVSTAMAFYVYRAERQRKIVAWGTELGARFTYDYQNSVLSKVLFNNEPEGPEWLRSIVGIDYYASPIVGLILGEQVTDITPLAGLTSLRYITLAGRNISDLGPVSELPRLKELSIIGCAVSDLTPLERLRSLERIDIMYVPVSELLPLTKLPRLRAVRIAESPIYDLSPLADIVNLEVLCLFEVPATDATPLAHLDNLQKLFLRAHQFSDDDILMLQSLPHVKFREY